MIATAEIQEEQFRKIIGKINRRFNVRIEASQEAYELFQEHIRFVAGRFWDEREKVDRKAMLERLTALTADVRSVKAQLLPIREGAHKTVDFEVVRFLSRAIDPAHAGQRPRPREALGISLKIIEGLEGYCERALDLLSELPARRGRPSLEWHNDLVSLVVRVAELVGIKVSTAGKRDEDP